MTGLPDNLTETPDWAAVDVLTDILASLRLTGGVITDARLTGDFCVRAEFTPEHCAPFFPMPETLIGYHYLRAGTAIVEVEGAEPVRLNAGEAVILPRNDPHLLSSGAGLPPADVGEITVVTTDGLHQMNTGTEGPATDVWCGFLGTAKHSAHPLLDALPRMLVVNISDVQEEWVDASMRFLAKQVQSPEVVSRLAESFVAQAIRQYIEQLPSGEGGWLAGLRDPAVAKALAIIHDRYAEELEVEELARAAGVSRSVLGERFVALLGEPPMRYCARWRMRMAANMLREAKQNTANIAYAVGFNSEAAFNRAFKREFGEPPATWRRRVEAEERAAAEATQRPELPPQIPRHATARDGTRLAWSAVGEGPPLIKTANWLNHLEFDFESPLWRGWIREFAADFQLIRYDERGNGLSDWSTPEMSLEAFVDDLACVADAAKVEQFDLLGISQGAAVAIAYSLRHPERVRRIVLLGGYAAGWRTRGDNEEIARREAMMTLTELGWGRDNPAYRQLFTSFYIPGASPEQMNWFNELQRRSASPENAVRLMRVLSTIDVRDLLPQVRHPTLVMHARGDQAVPIREGEIMAAAIPGAKFTVLDSDNHILIDREPAFLRFVDETRAFLRAPADVPQRVVQMA